MTSMRGGEQSVGQLVPSIPFPFHREAESVAREGVQGTSVTEEAAVDVLPHLP